MKIIGDKDLQGLWDIIENKYCFGPCCTQKRYNWITLPIPNKKYSLKEI